MKYAFVYMRRVWAAKECLIFKALCSESTGKSKVFSSLIVIQALQERCPKGKGKHGWRRYRVDRCRARVRARWLQSEADRKMWLVCTL
jgi:hypothetical protein